MGCVEIENTTALINNSEFNHNNALGDGGAAIDIHDIDNNYHKINIVNSLFVDNKGNSKGALAFIPKASINTSIDNQTKHTITDTYDLDDTTATEEFVIFTYNDNISNISKAITFPHLKQGKVLALNKRECKFEWPSVMRNNSIYYLTITTIFQPIQGICVQFKEQSGPMIVNWSNIANNTNDWMHLVSTTINNVDTNTVRCVLSETKVPTINRGTYCVGFYHYNFTYGIQIKPLYQWKHPMFTIIGSQFVNNSNLNGKGGALTITSNKTLLEPVSILIKDSIFNSNYANKGGAAVYQGLSEINHAISFEMSVLEIINSKIYNEYQQKRFGSSIFIETFYSNITSHGFIWDSAVLISDTLLSMTETFKSSNYHHGYGGIFLQTTNVYIGNCVISYGCANDGAGVWVNDSDLTMYNCTIKDSTASNNGGGLYHALAPEYSFYDHCVDIYYSQFDGNYAEFNGGAEYLNLHGTMKNDDQTRQSCIKFVGVTYIDNEAKQGTGDSVYMYIDKGDHNVLQEIKS
eukprot:61137_1